MAEQWKPIPGFDAYEVSNIGRVRSYLGTKRVPGHRNGFQHVRLSEPAILQANISSTGRYGVGLYVGLKRVRKEVHRLVLLAFAGECPVGMEACHNNGNPIDNRLENLRWDTHKNNFVDRERHGRTARGSSHGMAKLTEAQVKVIKKRLRLGDTLAQLARDYKVCPRTILNIREGIVWRHVHEEDV
jgi:hypothetical protein